MKITASIVLGGMAYLWAAGSGNAWAQQDYPNRPIRIIVPFPPGGSTDPMARIHMSFQMPITVIPFINSGKLRPIAITGDARLSVLPEVPTFAEAGLPGFGWSAWQGLAAPTGTPLGPRSKLATEMASILKSPETIDFIARQGSEPLIADPNETTALIKADVERYGKIVKAPNIKWTP